MFNKILIFADNINSEVETDDTFFHERAHRFIARWKGTVTDMMTLLSEFYNDTKGKPFDRWKKEITNAYKKQRGAKHNVQEEYFVNILGKAMAEGRLDELIEPWLAERGKEIVEEYLNEINYVRAEEQPRRNAAYRQHRLLSKSKSGGRGYGGNSGGVAPSDEDLLFNDGDDDVDVGGFDAGATAGKSRKGVFHVILAKWVIFFEKMQDLFLFCARIGLILQIKSILNGRSREKTAIA